jgi:hypothetical protein
VKKSTLTRNHRNACGRMLEALEPRTLFSLLGVLPGVPVTNVIGAPGTVSYNATTDSFTATGVPVAMLLSTTPFTITPVGGPSSFTLNISVNDSGVASSGSLANDVTLTGSVDVNGDTIADYTGTLLTGTIIAMGYQDAGSNDTFDFQFTVTGGALAPVYFTNKAIGLVLTTENSTFNGTFTSNFTAQTKGTIGVINLPGNPPPPPVTGGEFATIGFWHNRNGQNLIKSLNGSPNATNLSNWLATTFPNLYGNLAGMTNTQIAAYYKSNLFDVDAQKLYAQVFANALAVYATSSILAGGNYAGQYGFTVTPLGNGGATVNVGTSGAAYGVPNGTTLTVLETLQKLNNTALNGVLFANYFNIYPTSTLTLKQLGDMANEIADFINTHGDIAT